MLKTMSNDNLQLGILPAKYANSNDVVVQTLICIQMSSGNDTETPTMPKSLILKHENFETGEVHEAKYIKVPMTNGSLCV
jgi:hypothetical protein